MGSLYPALAPLYADLTAGGLGSREGTARMASTIWVSVNGSPSGDGSRDNPFNSIEAAQLAVRAILAAGPQAEDISVKIGGGTYHLPTALTFTAADSGNNGHVVRYEAVQGETPILSGGQAVTGWTAASHPGLDLAPGTTLWKAHVGTDIDTRQLYVDGDRATRAETNPAGTPGNPVYPEGFRPTSNMADNLDGINYVVTEANGANWRDPTTWKNLSDIEAVMYDQWKMMAVPLKSVSAQVGIDPGLITLDDSASAWTNANLSRIAPTGTLWDGLSVVTLNGEHSTQGIEVGMNVTGIGIAAGTTITGIDVAYNLITLSQPIDLPDHEIVQPNVALTITDPTTGQPIVEGPGIWSFWRVTKFENAYQFLDQPREWYLDRSTGDLYLIGEAGFDPNAHEIQLPRLEQLLVGHGAAAAPVSNLVFNGLDFRYATWLTPNGPDGYVSDQSGFRVVGGGHPTDVIGHVQDLERTPGNISFDYGVNIVISDSRFSHLGGVGLDFLPGAQGNTISNNVFQDISSAAIQLGGISAADARPATDGGITRDNTISGNIIEQAGAEFIDAAGIFIGFARNTEISDNYIANVPWSGIAMGWGWGLLDAGGFAGVPGADPGMWGPGLKPYPADDPTIMQGNRIVSNTITQFLQTVWDGGAIYTTGFQGTSAANGTEIRDNYFYAKNPNGGGNVIYTDGGTRYVTVEGNILLDNAQGHMDFGPIFSGSDPLNGLSSENPFTIFPLANSQKYGGEIGGCVTYGDISYIGNIWQDLWTTNPFAAVGFNPANWPANPLYYDPAPQNWTPALSFLGNKILDGTLVDNLLVLTRASATAVTRMDDQAGAVTFGLQSMRDGHTLSLLSDAHGHQSGALPYGAFSTAAWLGSESKALGSIGAATGLVGAGAWLPTASLAGTPLTLADLQVGANSILATFEGGYQANYMLGGSRSILQGTTGDHPTLEVSRLASQQNGLALYEADRANGAVEASGATLLPGDPGYLQAALDKALSAGLAFGPRDLPNYGQQAVLRDVPIDAAKNYGLLLIVNNDPATLFSSYAAANPHGDVQIVTLGQAGRGVTFGVEDLSLSSGHSDRDYNDLVVTLNFN